MEDLDRALLAQRFVLQVNLHLVPGRLPGMILGLLLGVGVNGDVIRRQDGQTVDPGLDGCGHDDGVLRHLAGQIQLVVGKQSVVGDEALQGVALGVGLGAFDQRHAVFALAAECERDLVAQRGILQQHALQRAVFQTVKSQALPLAQQRQRVDRHADGEFGLVVQLFGAPGV